jgi:hypothetical protein
MTSLPSGNGKSNRYGYRKPKHGDRWRAREVLPFLDLPRSAIRVAFVLIDRNGNGQCDPGGTRLAHDAKLKAFTMWEGIKALCDADLIDRTETHAPHFKRKSDWRRNSYQINWPKLNALYAELKVHRRGYRLKSVSGKPDMIPETVSGKPDMTASGKPDTNLETGETSKPKTNSESGFAAAADEFFHANQRRKQAWQA